LSAAEFASNRTAYRATLRGDALDYALFLPSIGLVCGLGNSVGLIGPLFVIIPVSSCLLYGILRRTVPPRLAGVYIGFCLVVAALSALRLMPASWQLYFLDEAVVRQLIPPLSWFAAAWASKAYFRGRLASGDILAHAPFFLFLSLVVAPALIYQQGLDYQGDRSIMAVLGYLGTFTSNISIAMFFILGGIFLTTGWRRAIALTALAAITALTHYLHFKLFAIATILIIMGIPGRKVNILLFAALVISYCVGIQFIPEVHNFDPNSGLRLAMAVDVLRSTIDTYGLGIGFGKESVRWIYQIPGVPDFKLVPDPWSITHERMLSVLSTGVENSFLQPLLRGGVLGFVLFMAAFFAAFPSAKLPRDRRNHAASLFAVMIAGCFVNSALETPMSAVGHGFLYGYLIALRAGSRPSYVPTASHINPSSLRAVGP
jgi:hypothetical protein